MHGAHGAHGALRGHWLRLAALTILALLCLAERAQALDAQAQEQELLSPAQLPAMAALDLAALRAAYPGAFQGMSRRPSGGLDLVLAQGGRLAYDDGRERTPEQALEEPDVRAMLAQVYPLGAPTPQTARPAPGFDPGRSRVEPLFLALYGGDEEAVRAVCRPVPFDGHKVLMNPRFGAADALARVWRRLAQRAARPAWRQALRPLGGGFCWREIAATDRLSAHAFGIAVDLNPALPYWLTCRRPEAAPARVLAFPRGIVAAFEAEGFIWGGKWAAFDLMHFEYRPELVLKARHLRGELRLPGAPSRKALGPGESRVAQGRWRTLPQRTMRPERVIFLPPHFQNHLCLPERIEQLPVQLLIPHLAVEALAVTVLSGRTRLNEQRLHSDIAQPVPHVMGSELGAVI